MYEVVLTSRAQHEFSKLSRDDQDCIDAAIDRLSANPRPPGIKKLFENTYRVRTGDWRIIYAVFNKNKLVLVGRIARRSEDTYDGARDLF